MLPYVSGLQMMDSQAVFGVSLLQMMLPSTSLYASPGALCEVFLRQSLLILT